MTDGWRGALRTVSTMLFAIGPVQDAPRVAAADQDDRTASAFNDGKKAWEVTKDSINDLVDAFTDLNGSIDQTLTNIVKRIAKFAFDVLVMEPLFKAIKAMISDALTPSGSGSGGGGGGGIFSFLGGLFSSGGSGAVSNVVPGTSTTFADALAAGTIALAGGGDSPVGVPYIVGENGPEIRIDNVPGHIYSHEDSIQMMRDLARGAQSPSMSGQSMLTSREYGDGAIAQTLVQNINVLPDVNVAIKRQIRDNLPLFAEAGLQRTLTERRQGGSRMKSTFAGR